MFKATVTGKRQITLPAELCKVLDINVGSQVGFAIKEGNKVEFVKCADEHEDLCPHCGKVVFTLGNLVNYGGRKYHLDCYYNSDVFNKKK